MSVMGVVVEDVSISFGEVHAVTGFSARFEPSRITALVGPSGSGKSTLLAAIAGFITPQQGSITLRDLETGIEDVPRADKIAWVSQGANALGARTVHDNVMIGALGDGIGLRAAAKLADEALAQVGLSHRSQALARTLSGGEIQRTAFARALASRRPLVLADEPTSSLDAHATQTIIELLNGLQSKSTIIVATHDPAVIEASDERVDMRMRVA